MTLRSFSSRFSADQRGIAVIEMALAAPVVAGAAFLSINLWEADLRENQQDEALRVAAEYYLAGGQDDVRARTLGLSAWKARPDDGVIIVQRRFRCGEMDVDATASCGADKTSPTAFVQITAKATTLGAPFSPVQVRTALAPLIQS